MDKKIETTEEIKRSETVEVTTANVGGGSGKVFEAGGEVPEGLLEEKNKFRSNTTDLGYKCSCGLIVVYMLIALVGLGSLEFFVNTNCKICSKPCLTTILVGVAYALFIICAAILVYGYVQMVVQHEEMEL